ncbi:MAG TPA: hypothetical protein VHA07_04600, partial [Devosia sp.]|nr:hypothetical protein [Devosia sp.]
IEECDVFRPLLGIDPDDLDNIVLEAGLSPVRDPSNSDRHYERVRWRQVMPELAELGLDLRRLGDFAARMADADALITASAESAFAALVHFGETQNAEMPRAGLAALNRAVAVRLLSRVLRTVGGERKPHALGAVEALHARLLQPGEMRPMTLHGCLVASDGITISVRREGARSRPILATAG